MMDPTDRRTSPLEDFSQPDIVVHGAVVLSHEDLLAYEPSRPEALPVCDLSAVVAEVVEPDVETL
jgi:hypothetical protein